MYILFNLNVPCDNQLSVISQTLKDETNIVSVEFRNVKFNSKDISIAIAPNSQYRSTRKFVIEDYTILLPIILISDVFINELILNEFGTTPYDQFVKMYFKDNQLLMNKWLRYGETVRGLN